MAKKQEIENRRNQLLKELEMHPEGLLYTELEQLLGKKKRTIAADVEDLRKAGSDILIKKDRVFLQRKGIVVTHSNKQTARRLALMIQAEENTLNRQSLIMSEKINAKNRTIVGSNSAKRVDTRDKTKEAYHICIGCDMPALFYD